MKQTIIYQLNTNFIQENHLHNISSIATKLYNTANYERKKLWEETGKIPNYNAQYKLLKDNHWYKLLSSQTAQAVLENLDRNYKSWFMLKKSDKTARPPRFRKKEMLSVLTYKQLFKIENNELRISMSRKYQEEHLIKYIKIPFINWKQIDGLPKQCQIKFIKGKWYAHIVYEINEQKPILNDNVMAIDLGIINTATITDTTGKSKVYSGKQILAIQHYFNKEKAKLQSVLTKQYPKRHSSKVLRILNKKQNRQITQALHTHSKNIIEDCKVKKIKTLVVGDITNIRKNKHWRKKTSQKLHSWSFSKFTQMLEYKCVQAGIRFVKVSEAYTSKTCSKCKIIKSNNRKHRGLYVCKCGNKQNADVNGALNILNKYLQDFLSRSIGIVAMPSVARITNVCPS